MTTMWCFQCGGEFRDATRCPECGVELVDEPPVPAEEVGTDADAQLAYELHAWAAESRRMLDQLLTAEAVPHAWQGASLIVLEVDEERVDAAVDEVERATAPTLDPGLEKVEYAMDGWTEAQQGRLVDELGLAGIPNEFDGEGCLLVHAIDEVRVDEVIDRLSETGFDDQADDDESGLDELDGHEVGELLSDVFVAVDRLRRDPDDLRGRNDLLDRGGRLASSRTPFGFSTDVWGDLRNRTQSLMEVIGEETTDDDLPVITEMAGALRETLHTFV